MRVHGKSRLFRKSIRMGFSVPTGTELECHAPEYIKRVGRMGNVQVHRGDVNVCIRDRGCGQGRDADRARIGDPASAAARALSPAYVPIPWPKGSEFPG